MTEDLTRTGGGPPDGDGGADAAPASGVPLSQIGHYRILRVIGEGGMGTVYEAEQDNPRRTVALKVIKSGFATEGLLRRFEQEAQVLGRLQHPGIAQIYEAGTADAGRGAQPYFAMEFVRGRTLDEHAAEKRLDIRERLELLARICDAVEHAHQKGIIHRDLKPGNVLVDESGQPKILDFGVARATDSDVQVTMHTNVGEIVGTLPYMSPEQVGGDATELDTRSDVYTLGVILYELLAGRRPYEIKHKTLPEAVRIIREDDPSRLSSVSRTFRGDVETIAAKALSKEKERRYQSAAELGADIRRYLKDEPIVARPSSAAYQLGKFARRNKALVGGLVAVFVVLVVGVVVSSWQAVRAMRAERQAATDAAIAKAVNAFLNNDLLAAAAPSEKRGHGKDVTMREVLDVAALRIEKASTDGGRFADEPLVEASIRITLGNTYLALGEYALAEPHLRRALALRRQALGEEHADTVRAINNLADLDWRQGRFDKAEPLYRKALEISNRTLGPDHTETMAYEMNLANLYRSQGRFEEAEPLYERNLETKLRVLGAEHPSTLDTMGNLANHYQETGRYEKAEALHRRVLATRRRVEGEKAPSTVSEMNNLGNDLALLGRYDEAEPLMHRVMELKIELYGGDHPSTLNSVSNLAELDVALGRYEEAAALQRQALDARTRVLGPSHPKTLLSMYLLSGTLSSLGRLAEAERLAGVAVAKSSESLGERHPNTLEAQDTRARALLGLGRAAEAESILRRQLTILGEKKAGGEDVGEGDALANAMRFHLGMTLAELGRRTEAEALLLESVPKLPPRTAETTRALQFLVRFYEAWDRSQPNQGIAARAAEWQQRLAANSVLK